MIDRPRRQRRAPVGNLYDRAERRSLIIHKAEQIQILDGYGPTFAAVKASMEGGLKQFFRQEDDTTSLKRIAGAAVLGTALLFGSGPFSSQAQAGYVVTLQEVGSDVVATGSGPIDPIGLSVVGPGVTGIGMNPQDGDIVTGPTPGGTINIYSGVTGPASFGSGDNTFPDSGSGDVVGLAADLNRLFVPIGYVSGDLSSSATFLGHTFATLGVDPGTYVWSWGTGPDQNFTLIIGAVAVPEPASLALLGTALAGLPLAGTRRRIRRKPIRANSGE